MPAGYSALPNSHSRPEEDEMEAAFEASDDEDDHDLDTSESRPLNPTRTSNSLEDDEDTPLARPFQGSSPPPTRPSHFRTQSTGPAAYDFENIGYDFPPPGSPPPRDRALVNNNWVCFT